MGGDGNETKVKPLARSFNLISLLIAASRVLGMIRDILYTKFLGASVYSDALFIALMIPNLFRNLFGEGALASAYAPVAQGEYNKGGDAALRRFFGFVFVKLSLFLGSVCLIIVACSFIYLAFDHDIAVALLPYTMPYLIFICLAALCQANLNLKEHFFIPAASPMLFNILIISGLLASKSVAGAGSPGQTVYFLALCVPAFGVVQLAIHFIPLYKKRLMPSFTSEYDVGARGELLRLFLPSLISLSVVQFNELADTIVAKVVIPFGGAVSHIYYANRLMQLPYALFGISIATAVFPRLVRYFSASDRANFSSSCEEAVKLTMFWILPASCGLFAASGQIIELLFLRGEFTKPSAEITSSLIKIYAAGLPILCFNYILIRVFYAMKDMKTPFVITILSTIINFVFNIILALYFYERGIAGATLLSSLLTFVAYLAVIRNRSISILTRGGITQIAVTALLATTTGFIADYLLGRVHVLAAISAACAFYLLASFAVNRRLLRSAFRMK